MKEYLLASLDDSMNAAKWLLENIGHHKIIRLDGEMGAGKTTLIKSIGAQLGVQQVVNSPTFSIVNEYETISGETIFHFDCYRIESINEALEIGIPEYFDSGNRCFIEWAENIALLLPDDTVVIKIFVDEKHQRIIRIE
jgi:tRNA threonylcarbamoyladenosine biosynthesis protein TsaE